MCSVARQGAQTLPLCCAALQMGFTVTDQQLLRIIALHKELEGGLRDRVRGSAHT